MQSLKTDYSLCALELAVNVAKYCVDDSERVSGLQFHQLCKASVILLTALNVGSDNAQPYLSEYRGKRQTANPLLSWTQGVALLAREDGDHFFFKAHVSHASCHWLTTGPDGALTAALRMFRTRRMATSIRKARSKELKDFIEALGNEESNGCSSASSPAAMPPTKLSTDDDSVTDEEGNNRLAGLVCPQTRAGDLTMEIDGEPDEHLHTYFVLRYSDDGQYQTVGPASVTEVSRCVEERSGAYTLKGPDADIPLCLPS